MSEPGKHTSGDGSVRDFTDDDIAELREAFKIFDVNRDGSISSEEMVKAMQILGNNPTLQEAEDIIKTVDADGNGRMDFEEFLEHMRHHLKEPEDVETELREAFQVFDKNNDHLIDAKEIKHLLKQIGEKITEDQIDEVFRKADLNQDGFIDYEEFVKLMMK